MVEVTGAELTELTAKEVTVNLLQQVVAVLEDAEQTYNRYPSEIKKYLDNLNTDQLPFGPKSYAELILAFSRVSLKTRSGLIDVFYSTINLLQENDTDFINKAETRILTYLYLFMQKLGSESLQQLENGLRSVEGNEESFLLLRFSGRNSEVILRHQLADECLKGFGVRAGQ